VDEIGNVMRELAAGFDAAWNGRDADALAAFFTDDADFGNAAGEVFRGIEGIRRHYREGVFPSLPVGLPHKTTPEDIRFVAQDVIIGNGTVRLFLESREAAEYAEMRVTAIMVKEGNRWLLSAVRLMVPA
jgi:uncharacterized protein (TIGR02246 family)